MHWRGEQDRLTEKQIALVKSQLRDKTDQELLPGPGAKSRHLLRGVPQKLVECINARLLFLAPAALTILGLPAAAQDRQLEQNFRVWFAYFGDHPFGDSRWGVHLEGQLRRQDGVSKWQQFLLRPALNYQANRLLMLSAGYASVRSYPRNPSAPRNENRIWEQAWLRYRTGNVAWSSRYRFENRFIEEANGQHRFENRIRAFQQATIPVSKRFYVTGYDEIFVWVKPYQASSLFDQNRAYTGLGFRLKPDWRFETAYMNQVLLLRSGRVLEVNHILMFSVLSTAAFRRSH